MLTALYTRSFLVWMLGVWISSLDDLSNVGSVRSSCLVVGLGSRNALSDDLMERDMVTK